jgi:hypothetical protein
MHQKVLVIISMRLEGKDNEEIAAALNIKPASVNQYMYWAGKYGWLSKDAVDPNDRLTHELSHKVVRNMDEALDSDDEERRDRMTVKVAEGVLFPRYKDQQQTVAPMTMLGVKIEFSHPPGEALPKVREGTTGGEPLWKEGEVVDGTQGPR